MSYKCEILADSLSPQSKRLTTFKVTYPRIVHAEFLRHRMLSRNVASSRAIPFEKMVKDVEENPFVPLAWQKAHTGMQGTEYFTGWRAKVIEIGWRTSAKVAIWGAKKLHKLGLSKQLTNRIIEPFVWTTELISGTEFENFFSLRCPSYAWKSGLPNGYRSRKDMIKSFTKRDLAVGLLPHPDDDLGWLKLNTSQAEIHIQKIAEMMWDCINQSIPKQLKSGDWHVPYGDSIDEGKAVDAWWDFTGDEQAESHEDALNKVSLKIATARAGRISYTTLGDNPKINYEADIKLHDKLLKSRHLSCFEHSARAMSDDEYYSFQRGWIDLEEIEVIDPEADTNGWCANYRGFISYRYLIENNKL